MRKRIGEMAAAAAAEASLDMNEEVLSFPSTHMR